MNVFVIMPFAAEFDDVYASIKSTVEAVVGADKGRCFRLDDSRPAGRITDRLLSELRAATICVADITHQKPNVMWEMGFAMALSKPTIIITQDLKQLPFDLKDMQSIEYERNRLAATLSVPLKRSLLDTSANLRESSGDSRNQAADKNAETIGLLMEEMASLKSMVAEAVAWKDGRGVAAHSLQDVNQIEGDWLNTESGTHIYARRINGEIVAPYCFGGNDRLSAVYYDWQRVGEFWFARYKWLDAELAGFTFLRMRSINDMHGAWWSAEQELAPLGLPNGEGVPSTWVRHQATSAPGWVTDFFSRIERDGIKTVLNKS